MKGSLRATTLQLATYHSVHNSALNNSPGPINVDDTMPYIDPEFDAPQIPDRERYEGTQVDDNVLAGMFFSPRSSKSESWS